MYLAGDDESQSRQCSAALCCKAFIQGQHLQQVFDDPRIFFFCKKSGIEKSYVQRWMPIVAASQSVKGKAAEREFLLSWVNVVDYE